MENDKSAAKKRLIIFSVFAFVIAWALFISIPLSGMTYGLGTSVILVIVAMFAPALANVLTRLMTKEGFHDMYLNPNLRGHIKFYILLYFAPTVLLFLSGAFYFLVFPGQFDPTLTTFKLLAAGNSGMTGTGLLIISIVKVVILGPIINIIPAMGQELGWRGYMLPKLRLLYSDRVALIITGAAWGLWYAPIVVFGFSYGTKYSGYPYLGIAMMVVFCIALGIAEGYVSLKLKSCVPAAMIHSTVNVPAAVVYSTVYAGAALPNYLSKGSFNSLLGPALTGIIGGLPLIVLAVILLIKTKGLGSGDDPDIEYFI